MIEHIKNAAIALGATALVAFPALGVESSDSTSTGSSNAVRFHLCVQECNIKFQGALQKCPHSCTDKCVFDIPIIGCVAWTEDLACVAACEAIATINFSTCMQLCAIHHPIGG